MFSYQSWKTRKLIFENQILLNPFDYLYIHHSKQIIFMIKYFIFYYIKFCHKFSQLILDRSTFIVASKYFFANSWLEDGKIVSDRIPCDRISNTAFNINLRMVKIS